MPFLTTLHHKAAMCTLLPLITSSSAPCDDPFYIQLSHHEMSVELDAALAYLLALTFNTQLYVGWAVVRPCNHDSRGGGRTATSYR